MLKKDKTEKRQERHKITQEDFTPDWVIETYLCKNIGEDIYTSPNKTVLDNSCGIGNILLYILRKRLENGLKPEEAVSSLYGVELMADNVAECRKRILDECVKAGGNEAELIPIIRNRIQWHDSLKFDYDNWPGIDYNHGHDLDCGLNLEEPMWSPENYAAVNKPEEELPWWRKQGFKGLKTAEREYKKLIKSGKIVLPEEPTLF